MCSPEEKNKAGFKQHEGELIMTQLSRSVNCPFKSLLHRFSCLDVRAQGSTLRELQVYTVCFSFLISPSLSCSPFTVFNCFVLCHIQYRYFKMNYFCAEISSALGSCVAPLLLLNGIMINQSWGLSCNNSLCTVRQEWRVKSQQNNCME